MVFVNYSFIYLPSLTNKKGAYTPSESLCLRRGVYAPLCIADVRVCYMSRRFYSPMYKLASLLVCRVLDKLPQNL